MDSKHVGSGSVFKVGVPGWEASAYRRLVLSLEVTFVECDVGGGLKQGGPIWDGGPLALRPLSVLPGIVAWLLIGNCSGIGRR